jgi:hypothetical protein
MEPTAPTTAILRAELDLRQPHPDERFASLRPGDRMIARVLRLEADGRALVDLGGQRALAASTADLRPGQRLLLEVVRTGPEWVLQIVPEKAEGRQTPAPTLDLSAPPGRMTVAEWTRTVDQLSQALQSMAQGEQSPGSDIAPLRQALARLVAAFSPAPLNGSIADLTRWLKVAVEENGPLLESKLAELCSGAGHVSAGAAASLFERDLKAQLLSLQRDLERLSDAHLRAAEMTPKQAAALKQIVSHLLGHIEQQQFRMIQNGAQPDAFTLLTHVLPTADPDRPIQLKVYYPKRGSDSESQNHHCVALLLDLDRLGALRADLTMLDRHLQVAFYVRDETVRAHFQPHLSSITTVLNGLFGQIQVGVHVSEAKIMQFATEDGDDAVGRINIRA